MRRALGLLGAHGRWVLVAGLCLGIALPSLARIMAQAIVPLVGFILFLAALRLGPLSALPGRQALPRTLLTILSAQLLPPMLAAAALGAVGWLDTPAGIGTVLVLAGAPISGVPGLALLCGADAATTMRQLGLGTALLPLTALPVFHVLPIFPEPQMVLLGVLRLLLLIAVAGTCAGLLRRLFPALTRSAAASPVEGLMTLAMGLVVIGLMSAVGPALLVLDPSLFGLLALAFALHGGLAAIVWSTTRRRLPAAQAAALAITSSNRNLAIFLASLPSDSLAELLLFVGCFQVPIYLTPLILPRLPGWPRPTPAAA